MTVMTPEKISILLFLTALFSACVGFAGGCVFMWVDKFDKNKEGK